MMSLDRWERKIGIGRAGVQHDSRQVIQGQKELQLDVTEIVI